ncbi:MAG: glycosyltransferase [Pseudomonadota bacterium]
MTNNAPFIQSDRLSNPVVSIGLPVYNGSDFLAEALDAILAQEFGDFELIISDNASTDATAEICAQYANLDKRISVIRHPENLGAAKNYNHVFQRASAKYFKWAAHDDIILPEFLSRCVAAFEAYPKPCAIVYPQSEFIDETGQVVRGDRNTMHSTSSFPAARVHRAVQAMGLVTAVFGLFNRDILSRTRLIGSFVASDYVLLLECALLGAVLHLDGQPLFQRRIHQNMSRQANKTDREVLRWFDPNARSYLSSKQRLHLEFLKSIYGLDGLGLLDRQVCACTLVGSLVYRRARISAGLWRRKLRSETANLGT